MINKMLNKRLLFIFLSLFLFSSCAEGKKEALSAQELGQVLQKHPELISTLIQENPKLFIDAFRKASFSAKQLEQQEEKKKQEAERAEELKNPKQPALQGRFGLGKDNAPVTIVEYSDFQCPYCARARKTIQEVQKKYPGKIRLVYKHLPLPFHPQSRVAARYFEAVAEQSHEKAFRFHDILFEHQGELSKEGEKFLLSEAKKMKLNMKALKRAVAAKRISERIRQDEAEAHSFGFQGTPAFLLNGVSIYGAQPAEVFYELIDELLRHQKRAVEKKR